MTKLTLTKRDTGEKITLPESKAPATHSLRLTNRDTGVTYSATPDGGVTLFHPKWDAGAKFGAPPFALPDAASMLRWISDAEDFSKSVGNAFTKRQNTYQSPEGFRAYQEKTNEEIDRLVAWGKAARDDYDIKGEFLNRGLDIDTKEVLSIADQRLKQLEQIRQDLQREGKWWGQFQGQEDFDAYKKMKGYWDLTKKEDFAEKSKYKSTYHPERGDGFSPWTGMYSTSVFDDFDYDYINGNEKALGIQSANNVKTDAGILGVDNSERREMSEEEIAIFNYLYAQDTAKGDAEHKTAYQYIDDLTSNLYARKRIADEEWWAQKAYEDPVGSSVASILSSPGKFYSYMGQMLDYMEDGEIDQNAPYNHFVYENNAIQNQVAEGIREKSPGFWGDLGANAYGLGMSAAESLYTSLLMGGKHTGAVGEAAALVIMGSGAAADTVVRKKDMGYSDDRAFALGTAAGLIEAATEKMGFDALFDAGKMNKGAFHYIFNAAKANGAEEGTADLLNWTADAVYDLATGGNSSEFKLAVQAYKEDGKSESEAAGLAAVDFLSELAIDTLGGMITGGAIASMGAAGGAFNTYNTGRSFNAMGLSTQDIQAFIDKGLQRAPGTRAYDLALAAQQKLAVGGKLTNYELGRLYQANVQAIGGETDAAELLERAAQRTTQGKRVSNRLAESILESPSALRTLGDKTGVATFSQDLQELSKSQQREAVRHALYDYARASVAAETDQGTTVPPASQGPVVGQDTHQAGLPAQTQTGGTGMVTNDGKDGIVDGQWQTGERVPDGDGGRVHGTGAGEQAGSVGEGSVRTPGALEQGRTAIERQNLAKALRTKVSSAALGLDRGTDVPSVYVLEEADWDDGLRDTAQRVYQETGRKVTYVVGSIPIRTSGGGTRRVRGVYTPDGRVILQADHFNLTTDQIADHEIFHDKAFQTPGLVRDIEARIVERYGAEEFGKIVNTYIEKLRGVIDLPADADGEAINEAYIAVMEEIFADAYAGINAFGAHAENYRESVEGVMTERGVGRNQQTAAATDWRRGPPGSDNETAKHSTNEGFQQDIDDWDSQGRPAGERFILGSTGATLQGLGAMEADIYMEGDKISTILDNHPEMTISEIKRIPEILDDPVLILKSKGADRQGRNSRLVMFGSIKAQDGKPIMCVLDLRPTDRGFLLDDMQKVSSAYSKDSNPVDFVSSSEVLYADKKRTLRALRSIGFTDPTSLTLTQSGSMGSISYTGQNVNIQGVPFSEVVRQDATQTFQEEVQRQLQGRQQETDASTSEQDPKFSAEDDIDPFAAEIQRQLTGEDLPRKTRRGTITTTKQEWRQIQSAQMQKYAGLDEADIPAQGYVFAHDHFYVIRNYGVGNFAVALRLDPATEQDTVNSIIGGFADENVREFGAIDWAGSSERQRNTRRRSGRWPDAGNGGERTEVLHLGGEPDTGSDTPGVLRDGGGNLGAHGGTGGVTAKFSVEDDSGGDLETLSLPIIEEDGEAEPLAEDEEAALLEYKSSWSYRINSMLRDGDPMDQETYRKAEALDRAIRKLPVYPGTVYRRISFDAVGGQAALDAFLAEHQPGSGVRYPAFTSTAKMPEGYPVDGDLTVTMVIEGVSGHDVEGFGNNFEQEVLFARKSKFIVDRIETDAEGKPVIYAREVTEDGAGQLHSSEHGESVQQVQKTGGLHADLPEVSQDDSGRGDGGRGLSGIRGEGAENQGLTEQGPKFSAEDDIDPFAAEIQRQITGENPALQTKRDGRKYWRPRLKPAEWDLLNRKMDQGLGASDHFIDEATKWLFTTEKGVSVFAFYGIGDGTEATPLWAVGGSDANIAYASIDEFIGGWKDGTFRTATDYHKRLKNLRAQSARSVPGVSANENRGTTVGSRGVPGQRRGRSPGQRDGHAESAGNRVGEDVTPKFSIEDESPKGLSLPTVEDRGETEATEGAFESEQEVLRRDVESPERQRKERPKPVAESKPIIAKSDLRRTLLTTFSIPEGAKANVGAIIDGFADRLLREGTLTEEDRQAFFDRMYSEGVMTVEADEYFQTARRAVTGGRVYVTEAEKAEFGDDWNDFRKRAFAAGVYLTNNRQDPGVDVWNTELADTLPGIFDREELDSHAILERVVQTAEEGKDERVSLAEYAARMAKEEFIPEDELLDNLERQMDWALRTFAEKADLELKLRDRTGVKIAQERAARREMMERQREQKALRELQQKTLKQLQWLSKNRFRAPEELRKTWDEVLGDIDIYAAGAANELNWSKKYGATWRDLADMYNAAQDTDPNFLPSKELERIVARLSADKIGNMDIGALQDLYKAAVGLRTEFYNRNNVINDEERRLFAEVYTEATREIQGAPKGYTGKAGDRFINLEQLSPMNVLERMGGWNPNGVFYSMAKQLEQGERDMRDYLVRANRTLEGFLTEHQDWIKKADGQGEDAVWYEVQVPPLLELKMGDKPIFGEPVTVYMTPAQKVHLYLESKSYDNLRHMTGGRTFVDRELYAKGKRSEALAQGTTIRLAPETVKKLVADLTEEEMELARLLDAYYNQFAKGEINRVSNILYGFDKAQGKNYAPIYTNENYTKSEVGVFDTTAEGVGNLKGRQYATNPSYNLSAIDAFERHADQMARFVGMAIPARNWQTLLNWREKNNSMGDVITHKWGQESKRYIEDLLTALQGGKSVERNWVGDGIEKLFSNYISAVFGANPSIVFKQLGSIPLASVYLDIKNLPTPAQVAGIDRKLIAKYTSELAWRTMGYSTPETKQLKDNPNWTQTNKAVKFAFGGGAITAMDGWAAGVLWPWAENKVRRENPDLELGTQAQIDAGESPFYRKVAEEFNDAVARSQSTSDEMHQGRMRKSRHPLVRPFTMFKSDASQVYNAIRQAVGEAQYYARTGADEQTTRRASRRVGAVFLAAIGGYTWAQLISFLMALWKRKDKRYRDDDGELTPESVIQEMVLGLVGDMAGVVTGGEELAEIVGNWITGDKWNGIDTPGMEQLEDIIDLIGKEVQSGAELWTGAIDVVKNGGDLMEYLRRHGADILGSVKTIAMAAATYIPGLPVNNLEAYLLGAVRWVAPELATAYEDATATANKSKLAGLTGKALETRVRDILSNRLGETSGETVGILAGLYEEGYAGAIPPDTPGSVSVDGESQTLSSHQEQFYDLVWRENVARALDELTSAGPFQNSDPVTQEKMLKKLYDYAAQRAKAELFEDYEPDKWVTEAAASGNVADWIAWNVRSGGNAATFGTLTEAGLDNEDALALAEDIGALEPEEGRKQVTNLQRLRAAVDAFSDQDDQLAAFAAILGESEFAKVQTGVQYGVTPRMYVEAREAVGEIDDNGSVTQAEATEAIDAMPELTDAERAVLWQLQNKSWKPTKNPFGPETGQEVYDAMHAEDEPQGLSLPTVENDGDEETWDEVPGLSLPSIEN